MMKVKKVTHKNIERLVKGIVSNFATIVAISQFLPSNEQEKLERQSQELADRSERLRDANNKRLNKRR